MTMNDSQKTLAEVSAICNCLPTCEEECPLYGICREDARLGDYVPQITAMEHTIAFALYREMGNALVQRDGEGNLYISGIEVPKTLFEMIGPNQEITLKQLLSY